MTNNIIPKPWQHKDAYIIGDGKTFSVTLAPQGETNKKIDKAPIVYQVTDKGQWTDISNVQLVDLAKEPIDKAPTFKLDKSEANRILDGKPVDVNWTRGLDVYLFESGNKVMIHQEPHEARSLDKVLLRNYLNKPHVTKIINDGHTLYGDMDDQLIDVFRNHFRQPTIKPTSDEVDLLKAYITTKTQGADVQLELSDLDFATNEHLYDDIYGEKDEFATNDKEHSELYDIEHLYDDVFAPKTHSVDMIGKTGAVKN